MKGTVSCSDSLWQRPWLAASSECPSLDFKDENDVARVSLSLCDEAGLALRDIEGKPRLVLSVYRDEPCWCNNPDSSYTFPSLPDSLHGYGGILNSWRKSRQNGLSHLSETVTESVPYYYNSSL
jgi:hypothetical protein